MATYLVTGGTGLVGRRLVPLLLERGGTVHLLTRASSTHKVDAMREELGAGERLVAVTGDLTEELLGLSEEDLSSLQGVDHVVHAGAVYDMEADDESTEKANVEGTRAVVAVAERVGAGRLHHVSSVAVAGDFKGFFREDMFDEGQDLPSTYHRSKHEAERLVREQTHTPWRVYRPAIVVGDSRTGEMDKVDGPYYFFPLIKRLRHALPEWVPLVGPELGRTNVVPVDYVARAIDHIAHADDLDGQAFHLTHPKGQLSGDVLNAFMGAAHAPRFGLRVDQKLLDNLPKGVVSMLFQIPALKSIRDDVMRDMGVPPQVMEHTSFRPTFDTRDSERALRGTDIAVPELEDYAWRLWDYWERHLDPDTHRDTSLAAHLRGKTVLITGASSGIGEATAQKVAAAGGVPLLVARTKEKLDEVRERIEERGGTAHVYTADLAEPERITALVDGILADHAKIDFVVNNAGRSIRRSVKLSYDRPHDFERTMQLNYFGVVNLMLAVLPHMTSTGGGHVVNISSIGVQTAPPRFSAYVASKAAMDAWTRCVASEVVGDGVTFTTIHMPLVKTPMIAPTKIYDAFPTITPEQAADMVCEGLRTRPKTINTRLGHLRRGVLRARSEGGGPGPAPRLPGLPRLDGGQGQGRGQGRGRGRQGLRRRGLRQRRGGPEGGPRGRGARVRAARRPLVRRGPSR